MPNTSEQDAGADLGTGDTSGDTVELYLEGGSHELYYIHESDVNSLLIGQGFQTIGMVVGGFIIAVGSVDSFGISPDKRPEYLLAGFLIQIISVLGGIVFMGWKKSNSRKVIHQLVPNTSS